MHADGERSALWGVRSVQAAQPIEAALGFLALRGFANSAPITFSLRLIQARRKPMAPFPRVLVSDEAITIPTPFGRSEEHTSELQSRFDLVCRLLLEKKKQGDRRPVAAQLTRPGHARPGPRRPPCPQVGRLG